MSQSEFKRAKIIRVRVKKEDSAYLTGILDAQPGLVSHTTLDHINGDFHRDLDLTVPRGCEKEVENLLEALRIELNLEILGDRSS